MFGSSRGTTMHPSASHARLGGKSKLLTFVPPASLLVLSCLKPALAANGKSLEEIRHSGAFKLPEALRQAPNMQVVRGVFDRAVFFKVVLRK